LTIGSLGFAGFSLVDLLRAEDEAGIRSSTKSIINVHLDGGPPQLDTIDPKPRAPVEIRGEFGAIATAVPGLFIGEQLPRIARAMGEFALVRTLVGSAGAHNAFQCQSGFSEQDLRSLGGRPAMGSIICRLRGSPTDASPLFVDLMQGRPLVRNSARPGFLGPAYMPFRPDLSHVFPRELEPGMKNELARLGDGQMTSLALSPELSAERLDDRRALLTGLDRLRREVDGSGMMEAMDRFTSQAAGILTSGRLAEALDLDSERASVVERYTPEQGAGPLAHYTSEGPVAVKKFLLARRLIEAGVRYVSLSISDFDTHSDNFPRMKQLLPVVDHGLTALVEDLHERGMLDDVMVVAWGEFGRTPRVDPASGGRHHWPQVGPAILAGGAIRGGQAIGVTDREAAAPIERPVTYKDVFATLFRHMGIDAGRATLVDPQGRPQHILDEGEAIGELG
jgi:hypothetical protein